MSSLGCRVRSEVSVVTPPVRQVLVPTSLAAMFSSALAVAVNVATAAMTDGWLWAAVVALTVLTFLTSLWLHQRAAGPGPGSSGLGQSPAGQVVSSSRVGGSVYQVSRVKSVHLDGHD